MLAFRMAVHYVQTPANTATCATFGTLVFLLTYFFTATPVSAVAAFGRTTAVPARLSLEVLLFLCLLEVWCIPSFSSSFFCLSSVRCWFVYIFWRRPFCACRFRFHWRITLYIPSTYNCGLADMFRQVVRFRLRAAFHPGRVICALLHAFPHRHCWPPACVWLLHVTGWFDSCPLYCLFVFVFVSRLRFVAITAGRSVNSISCSRRGVRGRCVGGRLLACGGGGRRRCLFLLALAVLLPCCLLPSVLCRTCVLRGGRFQTWTGGLR